MKRIFRLLDVILPPRTAHAHCDVPCGVYETDSMMWAVETCQKMVEKMLVLSPPTSNDPKQHAEYHNTAARMTATKEEYAHICKNQILILWTDYFKPEHLTKWPDLHEKVWKATKQCSTVKRTVSLEEVAKLHALCEEIAGIFKATKS